MKSLICTFLASLTVIVFAQDAKPVASANATASKARKIDRKHLAEVLYKRNGPMLSLPGLPQGKIVYVNAAATRVPAEWLETNAAVFRASSRLTIEVTSGTFDLSAPEKVGNASLFVVDDLKLPSLLLAPEAGWCMVNVAPLATGAGEKSAFFRARVQKELTRGFCLLAGSQTSNYPHSLMGCVTKPEDLDQFVDCRLPVDVLSRFKDYVAGYGIKPDVKVSYRKACQEGWAPTPTNDVEKAVWDSVHTVPKQPMKISYDPKKGR